MWQQITTKLCMQVEYICTIFAPQTFSDMASTFGTRRRRKFREICPIWLSYAKFHVNNPSNNKPQNRNLRKLNIGSGASCKNDKITHRCCRKLLNITFSNRHLITSAQHIHNMRILFQFSFPRTLQIMDKQLSGHSDTKVITDAEMLL